jgi:hypothetical protein
MVWKFWGLALAAATLGCGGGSDDGGNKDELEQAGGRPGDDPDEGDDFEPLVCERDARDDACSACLKAPCCETLSACAANTECGAFFACVDPCADDACIGACQEAHPAAEKAARALVSCMNEECAAECIESEPEPGIIPPDLIGGWGFSSGLGSYVIDVNGQTGSPNSLEEHYVFEADGTYEHCLRDVTGAAGLNELMLGGYESGTVTVSGGTLTLHPIVAKVIFNGASMDGDKTPDVHPFELATDPNDPSQLDLVLTYPNYGNQRSVFMPSEFRCTLD